jgi:hypothetical protein
MAVKKPPSDRTYDELHSIQEYVKSVDIFECLGMDEQSLARAIQVGGLSCVKVVCGCVGVGGSGWVCEVTYVFVK